VLAGTKFAVVTELWGPPKMGLPMRLILRSSTVTNWRQRSDRIPVHRELSHYNGLP